MLGVYCFERRTSVTSPTVTTINRSTLSQGIPGTDDLIRIKSTVAAPSQLNGIMGIKRTQDI